MEKSSTLLHHVSFELRDRAALPLALDMKKGITTDEVPSMVVP